MIAGMSDAGHPDDSAPTEPDQPEPRTLTPFLVAAVIGILVLGGVLLTGVLAPAEKHVTEQDRIAGAVREFADASDRYGLKPPEPAVCQGFDPARSPLAGRLAPDSSEADVEISSFGAVQVTGDAATIVVTSRVDDTEATETWHLRRSGDGWLVCNQPAD